MEVVNFLSLKLVWDAPFASRMSFRADHVSS